jgi:hypothetical protein
MFGFFPDGFFLAAGIGVGVDTSSTKSAGGSTSVAVAVACTGVGTLPPNALTIESAVPAAAAAAAFLERGARFGFGVASIISFLSHPV